MFPTDVPPLLVRPNSTPSFRRTERAMAPPLTTLLLHANPNDNEEGKPFLRVVDTILDLEEAISITSEMYEVLAPIRDFQWPDPTKHLERCPYEPCKEDLLQYSGEGDEAYQERLKRLAARPEKSASRQASWLRCALIVITALDFARQEAPKRELEISFISDRFYQYVWICLNQGLGVRVWKKQPPLLPSHIIGYARAAWYAETASGIYNTVVLRWYEGKPLEEQLGGWNLRDHLTTEMEELKQRLETQLNKDE